MRTGQIKKEIRRLSAENDARLARINLQLKTAREKITTGKAGKKPERRHYFYQTAKYLLLGAAGIFLIRKSPKLVAGTLGAVIPPVIKWTVNTVVSKALSGKQA